MTGPADDARNDAPHLLTPRLELSFGRDEDADVLFPFVHGEPGRAVTNTLQWDGPDRPDDLRGFFRLHGTGTFVPHGFHWLLRDRDGSLAGEAGRALGSIGIRRGREPGAGDIGYWIAPPYWGRGLMAEAIAALVDHAFDRLGFAAVEAQVYAFNARGLALLDKLGFRRVRPLPAYAVKRGRRVDGWQFSIAPGRLVRPR